MFFALALFFFLTFFTLTLLSRKLLLLQGFHGLLTSFTLLRQGLCGAFEP